ncbi:hypothetical protein GF325_15355 [Candidatus Bathyarchaeota archaeon]|nr:hypothetical protein [Candidatus Bathyarchaeota archaeon]
MNPPESGHHQDATGVERAEQEGNNVHVCRSDVRVGARFGPERGAERWGCAIIATATCHGVGCPLSPGRRSPGERQ